MAPTKTMLVWKSNRVDKEDRISDAFIIETFKRCLPGSPCWAMNRPLDIQVAQHISFCMDYAFESPEYKKFSKRNWDELCLAMEDRWEKDPA